MPDTDRNKSVVRRVREAMAAGELAALDAHPGLANHRAHVPGIRVAFPDLSLEIAEQVAEGDLVATRTIWSGTHRAEYLGVPATGRRVTWSNVSFDRVRDGIIVEHHGVSDWQAVLDQLRGGNK